MKPLETRADTTHSPEQRYVYIDESGYTGNDLLNREQPNLAFSAIYISEEEATQLKDKYFSRSQIPELKHRVLCRRRANWDKLLATQKELLDCHNGLSYIAQKEYMCVLKLFDICIEPVFFSNGLDFYENGQFLELASVVKLAAPQFWGEERYADLLHLFQTAITDKKMESVRDLQAHARSLLRFEMGEYLRPIADGHPAFIDSILHDHASTDVAISLLCGLISRLETMIDEPYAIIHDKSSALANYHDFLTSLIDVESEYHFDISDLCRFSYPLKFSGVAEYDSKEKIGIQLVDILVGGVVDGVKVLASSQAANGYRENVLSNYSDYNLMHMFPNPNFKDIRERFKGSQLQEHLNFVTAAQLHDKRE